MPSEPWCCQHPEHYPGSSSTGCHLCFSRSPLPHLLLQPCIYSGYPQLCQPRAVSPPELSLGHPPLCHHPVQLCCPCLQQEIAQSAHCHLSCHSTQELLKLRWKHIICLRGKYGRHEIFFWWGSSLREKTNPSKGTAQLQNL